MLAFLILILTADKALAICAETDSVFSATICNGDTFYVGTYAHTQSNTYSDTLMNVNGCDSVVTLTLTVVQPVIDSITNAVCAGDTVFFYGRNLTTAGTYLDTLTAATTGCDSVIVLNLSFIAPVTQAVYDTICTGGSFIYNGQVYTIPGNHVDTLTATTGCDSIVTLHLSVRPVLTGAISQSICHGGAYTFNGVNLSTPGVYKDTVTTLSGCDSVVTLTLSYTADAPHNINQTICQGESYVFLGDTLTFSGVYYDTLVASTGCDSVIVLTLNILPHPVAPYIVASGSVLTSSEGTSYQWYFNGSPLAGDTGASTTVTESGVYQVQITGPNGCSNISGPYHEYALGINGVAADWDVRLYPNPNTGLFVIAFTDNVTRTVQITDAVGNVIMTDENAGGTKEYNMAATSGGVYFVRIKKQEETRVLRFVMAK